MVSEWVEPEPEPVVSSDWTTYDWLCPFDGLAIPKVSRRTGRHYIGCPECNAFARPGQLPPDPLAFTTDRTATLRRLVAAVLAERQGRRPLSVIERGDLPW